MSAELADVHRSVFVLYVSGRASVPVPVQNSA